MKKQWSSYFQRLLNEQRYAEAERKRIDALSEQFEDLKTAILSSIDNGGQKEIARGIMRFRRMSDFLFGLKTLDIKYLENTDDNWEEVLQHAGIKSIADANLLDTRYTAGPRPRTYLVTEDNYFYEVRITEDMINELSLDWSAFISMNKKSREIIIETLSEMGRGMPFMRFYKKDFESYICQRNPSYDEIIILNECTIKKSTIKV